MGEAELLPDRNELMIHAHFVFYGNFATPALAEQLRAETEDLWNEPRGIAVIGGRRTTVRFAISAECNPGLDEYSVLSNTDPRANFFRIEDYSEINISFVDGLGCNTGYFFLENLYPGSTTAAHEFGHTLGLDHPQDMDWRGRGTPGIMCARGTLVDPQFQYDSAKPAGVTGGTMHPMHRRVRQRDIDDLRLDRLRFANGRAILGAFSNIYHWSHQR
ncbi:MAG: peptidase M10 [Chitinophagaceae bacterium]|nr:MAG: peptidase M10 [Chitinophagaceae bacterium]